MTRLNKDSAILIQVFGELRGDYPMLLSEGDRQAIKDDDPNAMFLTLPIAKVGAFSENRQREYSRGEVERIVNAVNTVKPEGRVGHVDMKARENALPPLTWLAAELADDGTAWGVAYIPGYSADVQTYLKSRKRANARVGTSIWGTVQVGEAGEWDNINLQAIDLAGHPDAISVQDLRAVPVLETKQDDQDEGSMSETTKPRHQFIEEMTADDVKFVPVAVQESIVKQSDEYRMVAELRQAFGEGVTVEELKGLRDEMQAIEETARETAIDTAISEMVLGDAPAEHPAVKVVRSAVRMRAVAKAPKVDAVRETITALLAEDDMSAIVEETIKTISGPKHQPVMSAEAGNGNGFLSSKPGKDS